MSVIEKTIEINVPVKTAYNQWTQFEEFPRFMEGVKHVQQLTDKRLHWDVEIAGKLKEWTAKIVEQIPDRRIAWVSESGQKTSGAVSFEADGPGRTRVEVELRYEPDSLLESMADSVGFVSHRVESDLERFKAFIEERRQETGSWRGTIKE